MPPANAPRCCPLCRKQAAQEFVQLADRGEPFIVQLGWGALCACVPCRRARAVASSTLSGTPADAALASAAQIVLLLAGAGGVGPQRGAYAAPEAPAARLLADARSFSLRSCKCRAASVAFLSRTSCDARVRGTHADSRRAVSKSSCLCVAVASAVCRDAAPAMQHACARPSARRVAATKPANTASECKQAEGSVARQAASAVTQSLGGRQALYGHLYRHSSTARHHACLHQRGLRRVASSATRARARATLSAASVQPAARARRCVRQRRC
jgi:hypothetical protein